MLFGAHVSVAKGLVEALDYAQSVGCECAQIFAKSPRQWRGPATDPASAERFRQAVADRAFGPVFTHTAYLINLGAIDPEMRGKSIAALADELARGALLGAVGVVTHIGTAPDGDRAAAAERVGEAIVRAFEAAGDAATHARLLLENTAGAGTTFGSDLDEIRACISAADLPTERLGVCIDTCHAFAQGAELDSEAGWRAYADSIVATVGIDRLGLIHANDCMYERGSKRDRHAWIGDGHIGMDGFSAMVCVPELARIPVVTEMPGVPPEKDAVNVGRLKDLREACGASQ